VEKTYFGWPEEFGRMRAEQARRLKALEVEYAKLKPSSPYLHPVDE
jgi:hypothetical protein|tara:strand:+ start:535 stop:672 length:138 start_codon:yes stop_codon:yes gene_type:complete